MGVLEKLPTFLTVCVLVMIFACLKRHTRCARLTLWSIGWTLVFTHFLAQLLEPVSGAGIPLLRALDGGALMFSAVVFLVSLSSVVEDRLRRTLLLAGLAIPFVSYAALDGLHITARWPYVLCVIAGFAAAAGFTVWAKNSFSLYTGVVIFFCSLAGAWALRTVLHGWFQEGAVILLTLVFALAGVFMCRNYWSPTPAVLTIAGGFFCWAAVFPILLGHGFSRGILLPSALWDTPKLFVAFGMILAVVEDKSHAIVGMEHKAGELQRQLERFSALSSRLLSSAAPATICPDIASAVTELTRFRAVVIHVDQGDGNLRVAGASYTEEGCLRALQQRTRDWTSSLIKSLCSHAHRIGNGSFLLPQAEPSTSGQAATGAAAQEPGLELLIPLLSASGTCLGSVALLGPADESTISLEELARVESLAADLAVAVELKSLHMQLVCSEKLAAMGQLVAGVAHELNNPLTAIMGFGELISDAVTCKSTNDQLQRLMRETRRMKRITDNLLRFSRQGSAEASAARLMPVLQEVSALCEYYTRKAQIAIEIDVPSNLPSLAISEDEIKQVLLNLFNNSCDALQDSAGPRKILIRAYLSGTRVVIEVEDNGPGFANLDRALDPFYTTKPAGKGTGLGLSICCGVAKRRAGDLRIENVTPHGGRVTLELPLAQGVASPLIFAGAHA